jgi:hypothetical protein
MKSGGFLFSGQRFFAIVMKNAMKSTAFRAGDEI